MLTLQYASRLPGQAHVKFSSAILQNLCFNPILIFSIYCRAVQRLHRNVREAAIIEALKIAAKVQISIETAE